MRRGIICTAALLAALNVIANSTFASAQRGGNEHSHTQVIKLVERIAGAPIFDDGGAAGPGVGDRLIFSADIFDKDDRKVGRDVADCVVVRLDPSQADPIEQQIVQCTVTVELPDGQITFQGLAQGTVNDFAVTGGTGAYRRAHGEAHVDDRVFLESSDVTITLTR
jgi:hypothetical protein